MVPVSGFHVVVFVLVTFVMNFINLYRSIYLSLVLPKKRDIKMSRLVCNFESQSLSIQLL